MLPQGIKNSLYLKEKIPNSPTPRCVRLLMVAGAHGHGGQCVARVVDGENR